MIIHVFVTRCRRSGNSRISCKYFGIPKTKTDWWTEKINITALKDWENGIELTKMRWKVIIVWECELKKRKVDKTLPSLYEEIVNGVLYHNLKGINTIFISGK